MKKYLQIVFGLVVSAVFLWFAFRKADFGQIFDILKQADIKLLLCAVFLSVLGLMIRSYRWKLLGKDYHNVPWINFFRATTIGLMLNAFLPFRTGDLFQSYFLSKKSNLPKSYTLATVFLERLVDSVPPALIIIIGSFFIALPSQLRISRLIIIAAIVGAVLYLFIRYHEKVMSLFGRFIQTSHSEKIKKLLENIKNALIFLKDKQVTTRAIPLTFLNWIIISNTITFLILRSLDIKISFFSAFLVMAIGVMSVAIPSSPGFIGTWEFFSLLALSIFNVDRDRALSYAVLSHFMAFLPITIIGLYYFYNEVFLRKALSLNEALNNSKEK